MSQPEPDLARLVRELDDAAQSARPIRFTSQVSVDRNRLYEILDGLRATIPESIRTVRRYRLTREEADEASPGQSVDHLIESLELIDELDNLLHKSAALPLSIRTVRVNQQRLSELVSALHTSLAPFAEELAESARLYPDLLASPEPAQMAETAELRRLLQQFAERVLLGKVIPLTFERRLELRELESLIAQMRSAVFRDVKEPAELNALLDQLDALVRKAKRVPLTSQVRIDPDEALEVAGALARAASGVPPT